MSDIKALCREAAEKITQTYDDTWLDEETIADIIESVLTGSDLFREGWQSCASIPRDGQVVLMSNGILIQVGCFLPADTPNRYVLYFAIPTNGAYGAVNVRSDSGFVPTHWMPLPPVPDRKA